MPLENAAAGRRTTDRLKRLLDALTDPGRRDRAVLVLLLGYTLVWTIYGAIAKSSQDVHSDMSEIVAWAHAPAPGYLKHPPVAAWVAAVWFELFPKADWSYYLLAMSVPAIGLWLAWRISADYLDGEKRILALALLTLIPFFNFHALKFNVNTVLIALWPLTTFCFLRSVETRGALWAALAGAAAAASMLGKYWSIVLLAGLALVPVLDSQRRIYFRSAAPWITVGVGAALIAPHVVWLIANNFAPFAYAIGLHGTESWPDRIASILGYLAGAIGYVALPTVLALAAAQPGRAALVDTLMPTSSRRRRIVIAFWGPLLLPVAIAFAGVRINSLWTMSAWALLGIILLSSPKIVIKPGPTRATLGFACLLPLMAVAASPAVAVAIHLRGLPPEATHASVLAPSVEQAWRATTDKPLLIIGGDLAYGVAFYLPGAPAFLSDLSRGEGGIDDVKLARSGVVIVCRTENHQCVAMADALGAQAVGSRTTETTVARRFAGTDGPAATYLIITVPPR